MRSIEFGFRWEFELQDNPFSTSKVAPGRIQWFPNDGPQLDALASKFLNANGFAAAIVGSHGTGKSTLLNALQPLLGPIKYRQDWSGREEFIDEHGDVLWLQLRRNSKPSSQIARSRRFWNAGDILILDGFEQLSPLARVITRMRCRWSKLRLLVTAHRPQFAMQTLLETKVDTGLAVEIVGKLTKGSPSWSEPSRLTQLLRENGGNMREVLMCLYDQFQNSDNPKKLVETGDIDGVAACLSSGKQSQ